MLLRITDFAGLDTGKLMKIYTESNYENTDYQDSKYHFNTVHLVPDGCIMRLEFQAGLFADVRRR